MFQDVKIWYPKLRYCVRKLSCHIVCVSLYVIEDDRTVSVCGKTFKVWNPESGECDGTWSNHFRIIVT